MRVESGLLRFAEIESADDPDIFGVRGLQDVAEHIAAGRQIGTYRMKFDARRIVGRDTTHAQQQHVGAHVRQLADKVRGVEIGIGFAQIRLHPANGFIQPPSIARGNEGRQQ
jgi:hypothetical protein